MLEKRYLRADDGHVPRLEIAWRPRQSISAATLHRRLRRMLGQATLEFHPPQAAPSLPQAIPFTFQSATTGHGLGAVVDIPPALSAIVLLHAPARRAASDDWPSTGEQPSPQSLLQTLALPPDGPLLPWRAFGLRLVAPRTYTLQRFHFQPGHFHLQFDGPARGLLRAPEGALILDRLAPASILLRGKTLPQWAATFHAGLPLRDGGLQADASGRCLTWRTLPAPVSWWRRQLGAPTQEQALRLWLDDTDTNIMALLARGAPARDEALLMELCTQYAISPTA